MIKIEQMNISISVIMLVMKMFNIFVLKDIVWIHPQSKKIYEDFHKMPLALPVGVTTTWLMYPPWVFFDFKGRC